MDRFLEFLRKVEDGFVLLSAAFIFVIMLHTVVDVTGRFFRIAIVGTVEITQLLLVAIIALAIAGTQRMGEHIGMDALLNTLSKMNRPLLPIFQTFTLLATEAMFLIALYYTSRAFLVALSTNETTAGPLWVITWPAKGILSLGLLLMCVRLATQLIQAIKSIRTWGKMK